MAFSYLQGWDMLVGSMLTIALSILFALLSRASDKSRRANSAADVNWDSTTCAKLAEALHDIVYPPGSTVFKASLQSYYSLQEQELIPRCIVKPQNPDQVSTAIRILKDQFDTQARTPSGEPLHFAIRSGGHGLEAVANIQNGIVLDLSDLSEVTVAEDEQTTVIGTGAHWGDVSSVLDQKNLAVAGGRNSNVGVGGLILGGGISFFSPRVGFVCSSVLNYEVVLANGTIINASEEENADLWRALKGGGNNFGVVTRFTVRTFPSTEIWGGYLYFTPGKKSKILQAFHDFARAENYDEYASGPITTFAYTQTFRLSIIASNVMYTKPVKWSACWQNFQAIGRLWSAAKTRSLKSATDELNNVTPKNVRQFQMTTTVENDLSTLHEAQNFSDGELNKIRQVKGLTWCFIIQPLPLATMSKGGVNSLGLSNRQESLVIVLVTASWKRREDDELVEGTIRSVTAGVDRIAQERGTSDPFRYLNYAAVEQDVFGGYGEENREFLRGVSQAYDPDRLFQQACIGGFKLGTA